MNRDRRQRPAEGAHHRPTQRSFLFVNENIGGHRTVHDGLRRVFDGRDDIEVDFVHGRRPSLAGKILGAPIPLLARFDLDLQPLRAALVHSLILRRRLSRALARKDYSAVHLYTQNGLLGGSRLLAGLPVVITTDSTWRRNSFRLPYRRPTRFTAAMSRVGMWFEKRVLAEADTIFANAVPVVDSLVSPDYRIPRDKVSHLTMGVWSPYSVADPARRDPSRRPTIVFIGMSMERKGGNTLLDLWRSEFAGEADLLLITKDEVPPCPGLRVVADLEPGDQRIWDLLAEADVMCFPSVIDQAPNVVLEGAFAGLPVVSHAGGAIPEMIEHGVTGYVVDCHDPRVIADALRELIADPELRARMGAAGLRRARERYDIHTSAATIIAALDAAAGTTALGEMR